MYDTPLKLSLSRGFIDKTPRTNKLAYKEGFEPHVLTLAELGYVVDQGYTFSYQFLNGKRSADNFLATDFLAIDVDYGMTIEQAMVNPIVEKYCSMIYKTANHTPDLHRFRLVFILPRTITNAKELSAATRSLAQRLGGDKAATDAARMFHGSKDSNPEVFERSINEAFLKELIEDGLTIPVSESSSYDVSTTSRSAYRPESILMVRTADARTVKAVSIKTTTSIYCPFHNDRHPSAFVSRNKRGSVFLHCPKCQKTWWLTDGNASKVVFDDFEQSLVDIKADQITDSKAAPLTSLFESPELIRPDNVHVFNTEHIHIPNIKSGLTLIKSPKGSGKTTFLERELNGVIEHYATLEELEENTEPDDFYSDETVLLIGHRQALIGELCQRLELNCYLDDKMREYGDQIIRRRRYGVCLDSLWRVEDQEYDTIVIDEVEQVLAHFFSDTLGEKRYGIFALFSNLLRKAKKIIALDADLGWTTYTTLTDLIRASDQNQTRGKAKKHQDKQVQVEVYLNQWKPEGRVIHIHPSVSQIIYMIKQDVIRGARIFVTSNSKAKIKALDASLQKFESELGRKIERIAITSENSKNADIQTFIKNIKTQCLKYQVILSSPSLGTGIDISFANGEQEIDSVYGLFENQINSHFEVDQQVARVRNPKQIHVWVSPSTFDFETEFEVVKQDYLRRNLLNTLGGGSFMFSSNASNEYESFLKLAALVISQQRASKNQLKKNFIEYRQKQGWTVIQVPADEDHKKQGLELFRAGVKLAKEERAQKLLHARVLDKREYDAMEEKLEDESSELSPDQWWSYLRTRLELFYRQPISREIIDMDSEGKFRRAVSMYELFSQISNQSYKEFAQKRSSDKHKKFTKQYLQLFKDRRAQAVVIHTLLSTTPIFNDGTFDLDLIFTQDDLKRFVKASRLLKGFVETQLEINTQLDLEKKPPQHLNKILGVIGLRHVSVQKTNKGGKPINKYQLDRNILDKMTEVVERRGQVGREGWDFVDQNYSFTYPDDDDVPDLFLKNTLSRQKRGSVSRNTKYSFTKG